MSRNHVVLPGWRKGWDAEAMRFMIRKYSDADCADDELWHVMDMDQLRVIAHTKTRKAAVLVADALEFLSGHANVDEFEAAIA